MENYWRTDFGSYSNNFGKQNDFLEATEFYGRPIYNKPQKSEKYWENIRILQSFAFFFKGQRDTTILW